MPKGKKRESEDGGKPCYYHMTGGCIDGSKCKNAHPEPPLNREGDLIVCRFDHHASGCRNILFCPFRHPRHPRSEVGESSSHRPPASGSDSPRGSFRRSSSSRNQLIASDDDEGQRRDTVGAKRSRSDSGQSNTKRFRTESESESSLERTSSSAEKKRLKKTEENKINELKVELEKKLERKEKKVIELDGKLQKTTNLVDFKNQIIQNNLTKISELSEKLSEKDAQIESLSGSLSEKISQKDESIESLLEKNKDLDKKFEEEQISKEDFKSKYEKLIVDYDLLKEGFECKKAELSNLEDDSKATEAEKNELHNKIIEQTNQLKNLEDNLRRVQREREEMEVERDNFDEENVDLREKFKRLQLQCDSQVEKLKVKLRERESDCKSLRDRNAELISSEETLKTSLKGREGAMTEAFRSIENLKSEKVKFEKERNILRDKVETLKSEMLSSKSEETQKERELKNELRIREMVITSLKTELSSSEGNARDALQAASTREKSLKSQVDEYNKSLRSKEAAMTEAFRSIENLKIDREKVAKENNSLIGICDKLKSEKSCLESVKENLAEKIIALEREEFKSKTEIQSLRLETNAERAKFNTEAQELHSTVTSLKKQQVDLEKKLEKISEADEVKGVFIQSLEERIKSNIEQFKQDINDLNRELRKKDLQLKSYEERVLPLLKSEFI